MIKSAGELMEVTIAHRWNDPHIQITVNEDEINLSIDMVDFIEAVKQELNPLLKEGVKKEIGSVTFVVTQDQFSRKVDEAFANIFNNALDGAFSTVIKKVKLESCKVM
jgi:hypothetical protein